MNTPCTWWEFTGRHAPLDEHGIGRAIYQNKATGEEVSKLPPGALYASSTAYPNMDGADGLTIFCVLPTGHRWCIDGRARNCTMPDDDEHRCWICHGTIGDELTIDKNGLTCNAGAGSIQVTGWHGFLRNGVLEEC